MLTFMPHVQGATGWGVVSLSALTEEGSSVDGVLLLDDNSKYSAVPYLKYTPRTMLSKCCVVPALC